MKAMVRRIGGLGASLAGQGDSGHWVPMDTSEEHGGSDGAASPMELLLLALGGCTGMDVLSILAKKRIRLDDFEIALEAERAETHPRVFTATKMVYRFYGEDLVLSDLEQAVQLSREKYCSVSAMLARAMPIEAVIEILPPRPAR